MEESTREMIMRERRGEERREEKKIEGNRGRVRTLKETEGDTKRDRYRGEIK